MNKIILVGRLSKDPEFKQTQSGISVCTFTVACNRKFKDADGNYKADFLNCVAWRQTADFVNRHFIKGNPILVEGTVQNRSYDGQDGAKHYVTEVIVEGVEFCGSAAKPTDQTAPAARNDEFTPVDDDELPF